MISLYRNDNLLTQMTRPDQVVIGFSYDAAKRLTGRTIGSEDTYQYTYNARDELITASNATGTMSLAYDVFGRTTSEQTNNETSTYQYNNEDEATQISSLGSVQAHQFDIRGLLSQIDVDGTTYDYIYDALARVTVLNRSVASNSSFQYDVADQLTQINHGTAQRSHQYQYDLANRINQWQGVASETRDYGYDEAGRLTAVQSPTTPEAFSYDSMGNRQNDNAQFDAANRLIEDDDFSYVYDINGNRTQSTHKTTGEVARYAYNSLDQLIAYRAYPDGDVSAAPATDYSYAYGPMARRWTKQDNLNTDTHQFYWSGNAMVGEDNNGTVRRYILEAQTPIGFVENNQVYHYLKDHLGTAHEIIDSNGAIVWQGDYDSFGAVTETVSDIQNNLRFAGQYADRESGLYYNYYRYYDPQDGRYVTSDPIGLGGGINTYGYVGQNPLHWIDPLGLYGLWPFGNTLGGNTTTTIGDAISEPNGNLVPGFKPQDGVCSGPACVLNPFPSMVVRCIAHDNCYDANACNSSSWIPTILGGTKPCNRCNSNF